MNDLNDLKEKYIFFLKNFQNFLENTKSLEVPPFVFTDLKPKIYIPSGKQKKIEKKTLEILTKEKERLENQNCLLCKNKLFAVQKYFKKPEEDPKKIMVLHYNGSLDPNKISKDVSAKYFFSSQEEDDLFNKMLSKVNLNLKHLYFMEFVACYFPSNSTQEDWIERVKNCFVFLKKNIYENTIEKLIITGNSALLFFGEEAKYYANQSSILDLAIEDKKISALVIRSPLAILTLEKKRKEYEEKLKKFKEEYKYFLENKNNLSLILEEIKNSVLGQKNLIVINKIKLVSASQIQLEKDIEKTILNKLGEKKYILYKAIFYRLEEIKIKTQVLNSLQKFV